jgi:S1-C subfamily serine protease
VNVIATPSSLQFGVRSAGAHVTYIMPGSNAAAVGLRAGDTVAKVNDETLEQGGDVELALDRCCTPGARIHLRVSRGGVPVELNGTYEPKNTFGSTVTLFPRRHPNGRVDLVN